MPIRIHPGRLDDPRVIALLDHHVTTARAQTAPESAHALDLSGLKAPEISFWSAWEGETLLGTGALKRLDAQHGEVKSMHTAAAARGRGVASAVLAHIIAEARRVHMRRLSLETGSQAYFLPAVSLYKKHGFVECPPFGDYRPDPNSLFLTLDLARMR